MMIFWVHTYVKTQRAIYFKYVQLIANYTSMKLFTNVLKSPAMAFIASLMISMLFTVYSVQFSSVAQSCPTLCDPMNHSMPGLPVHYQLPEPTHTHVHPSHPLSSPSPPAPNPSQHQSLFQWVNSSHDEVAKVLEFQLQHQSFQWIFRTDFL